MALASQDALERWNDLRVRLVWAYDGPVDAFPRCAFRPSPVVAWLLRRGHVTLRFPSGTERFGPRTWVFPRAEAGWQDFSADAEILSVRFVAELPTGESLFDRSRTLSVPATRLPRLARIGERLARVVRRCFPGVSVELRYMSGPPDQHFEIQRVFYGWLKEYAATLRQCGLAPRSMGQVDDRVREAVHFIETAGLRQPLREPRVAQEVGVSVAHLNRMFVRDLGKTPREYWEEKRIRATQTALLDSPKSVKAIAYDLGFNSLPHFSAWCRKKLGQAPSRFRRLEQDQAAAIGAGRASRRK